MIHVGGANSTDENKFELRTTLMYQCAHQTSHQAIWGAEDLGTILEYLAPRWRYSVSTGYRQPGNGKRDIILYSV